MYLTQKHETFRSQVRDFLQRNVTPHAQEWETKRAIPRSAWMAFGSAGLLGLSYPVSVGGSEMDPFSSTVFLEELGRLGYGGVRAAISLHSYMATHYLAKHGSAYLKQAYLSPAISGEMVGALAITERGAGSDLSRLATTARQIEGGFVVDGAKRFITNGICADFYVVVARTGSTDLAAGRSNQGMSLLLVDSKATGITRHAQEKLGWHSAGTAEVVFDSVFVPQIQLIGRVNSGFSYLMKGLQLERLVAATLSLGSIEFCMSDTVAYLKSREAFDGTLAHLQAIRHRLADLATELAATKALTYNATWTYQQDEFAITPCSITKLKATELACRVADECLQLQGGHGYLEDTAISRVYRDARAGTIAGGSTEVMRDIIAKQFIEMGECY